MRLFFMSALASLDEAMSQMKRSEKSSVRRLLPRPGRISGVGALVDKAASVGVADGGNQIMVGVGSGVSVAVSGVGVASITSSWAQDVMNNVIARATARSNLPLSRRLLTCTGVRRKCRRGERPPRNDIRNKNIIFIW